MTLTQKQLKRVLSDHKKWLLGTGGSRADLSWANLSGAILSGADLSWAKLSGAILSEANLSEAILPRADLSGANLSRAKLSRAILSWADLSGANLSGADLSWAKLSGAILSEANLSEAILPRADLSWANLSRANLSGAKLSGAILSWAKYNLFEILKLNINDITNELVLELMRWDATICGQDKMSEWAKGGRCPFSGNIARLFYFPEKRELWVSGNPTTSLLELWQWIAREKNIKI